MIQINYILAFITGLAIGILIGIELLYWWANREWHRNPYKFRTIINGVIERREARAKQKEEEQ